MIDLNALQEDLRKVAIALIIAALASYLLKHTNTLDTIGTACIGFVIWFAGLYRSPKEREKRNV